MLRHFAAPLIVVAMSTLILPCQAAELLSAGTGIEVRLSVSTGSRTSYADDPIQGVVIAPVFSEGKLLIPPGTLISGRIEKVQRLGLGLKHLTAILEYRFDSLHWPNGQTSPISAQLVKVETAKEQVNAGGVIRGIYPTASLSSSVAFYALPIICMDPELAAPILGIKFVIARSPDPEIYLPAGTEVILKLTAPAHIPSSGAPSNYLAPLSAEEVDNAHQILAKLPQQRTNRGRNHPSDLVNILFLGDQASIDRAFHAAGWSGAHRRSLLSIYRMYHCMVQRNGYRMAPMGKLTLNGLSADAEYQKSLNTFSKRHHLRLWRQGQEDAWLSAATEDISYKFRRMHLTHATDPLIDNERNKVLNDLAFTGCLDAGIMMTRNLLDNVEPPERSIATDGKIAVVRLNNCQNPQTMPVESATSGPRARGRPVQILVALRNDIIRSNPISLAFNTVEQIRQNQGSKVRREKSLLHANRAETQLSRSDAPQRWTRPSILD
ncbi:MAG: LssY C-terminal domain-containing protein [Bryobacteraceae bacterium]